MNCDFCDTATNIYSAGAGRVLQIETPGTAVPIAFSVDGSDVTFNNITSIATSVGIQAQSGFQFMHSMREFIYVYVFTERVGEIVINGLTFPGVCNSLSDDDAPTELNEPCLVGTGLERFLNWYECNRMTTRASPIIISFGDTVFYSAFLSSMKAEIANAETGIAQFSLRFNYIPRTTDNDDFCFSIDETCLDIPCGEDSSSVDWDYWFDSILDSGDTNTKKRQDILELFEQGCDGGFEDWGTAAEDVDVILEAAITNEERIIQLNTMIEDRCVE